MYDINRLTGNELSLVESLSGASIVAFGNPEKPMTKGIYALALVIKRKEDHNPGLTFNEVLDLPFSEVIEIVGLNEEEEETEEEGESVASEKPAPKPKRS